MKKLTVCILVYLVVFVGSCRGKETMLVLLDNVESLLETNPDSAYALLNSVNDIDNLPDADFSRWCLLWGKVANHVSDGAKDMRPSVQLRRAYSYYLAHGTIEEQAAIQLYLGRSYAESGEYDTAAKNYEEAFDRAVKCEAYNEAGMIDSYWGDLYSETNQTELARKKYGEAIEFFNKAGNLRTMALVLNDLGFEYLYYMGDEEGGLQYFLQADSIAHLINDTSVITLTLSNLGALYMEVGEYDLAENLYDQVLALTSAKDTTDLFATYFALTSLYIGKKDWTKAREMLQKSDLRNIDGGITYSLYQIEKGEGHLAEALAHLEKYQELLDSLQKKATETHLAELETKYQNEHSKNELNLFKIREQRFWLAIAFAVIILLTVLFLMQTRIKYKNMVIYEHKKALSKADADIALLSNELQTQKVDLQDTKSLLGSLQQNKDENIAKRQKRITQLSEQIFQLKMDKIKQTSVVGKKIAKLCQNQRLGLHTSLSDKDITSLIELVGETYPRLKAYWENPKYSLTKAEMRYACMSLLKLSAKDSARVLGIQPTSIDKGRQRLRQVLNVDEGDDLFAHFKTFCLD